MGGGQWPCHFNHVLKEANIKIECKDIAIDFMA